MYYYLPHQIPYQNYDIKNFDIVINRYIYHTMQIPENDYVSSV